MKLEGHFEIVSAKTVVIRNTDYRDGRGGKKSVELHIGDQAFSIHVKVNAKKLIKELQEAQAWLEEK